MKCRFIVVSVQDNRRRAITRYFIIWYFYCSSRSQKDWEEKSLMKQNLKTHLNKLYSRLWYNDNSKYLPPRFSYALNDLAYFFGILSKETTDTRQQDSQFQNEDRIFADIEGKGGQSLTSQASFSELSTTTKNTKKVRFYSMLLDFLCWFVITKW